MNLEEAIRHALDGNAVLFLGAGFSVGAKNKAQEDFPLATELARDILATSGETESIPLQIAVEQYKDQHGEVGLLKYLDSHLGVSDITNYHERIAEIPWKRVYTTNYDEVFEIACERVGKKVRPHVTTTPIGQLEKKALHCVHLNGYLPWAKVGNIDTTLILSETAYLTSMFLSSSWARFFFDDIKSARAIIFIGYSIADLDIGRVLVSAEISHKSVFVVKPSPSLSLKKTIAKFGTLSDIGVDGFSAACGEVSKTHIQAQSNVQLLSFRKPIEPLGTLAPTSGDIFDLFVKGKLDHKILASGLANPKTKYAVRRREIALVEEAFKNGHQVVVLLARLGNGKTILAESIASYLSDKLDVYIFSSDHLSLAAELEYLKGVDKPTLLVIDNYAQHLDIVSQLHIQTNKHLYLLLTCRTPMHLTNRVRLLDALDGVAHLELRADNLADGELDELGQVLAGAGLLGEHAKLSKEKRARLFKVGGAAEFGSILLSLLDSPVIKQKLSEAFASLSSNNPDVLRVAVAAMVLMHMNADCDIYDLADLIGAGTINQALFSEQQEVSDLLHFQGRVLKTYSSIFASAAIRTLWEKASVASVLEIMLRQSWVGKEEKRYRKITKDLMRYSVIKELVPRENMVAQIRGYYERIRNFEACANNEFFWVQMTLVDIFSKQFEQAERHLSQAYALAKNLKNFDTYQLDNVRAHLLLAREIDAGGAPASFQKFVEAAKIISKQMAGWEFGYYPYRVACLYGDFWRVVASRWGDVQRGVFISTCKAVLLQCENASPDLAGMNEVMRCRNEMNEILRLSSH